MRDTYLNTLYYGLGFDRVISFRSYKKMNEHRSDVEIYNAYKAYIHNKKRRN